MASEETKSPPTVDTAPPDDGSARASLASKSPRTPLSASSKADRKKVKESGTKSGGALERLSTITRMRLDGIPPDELAEIHRAFEVVDLNGDGGASREELDMVLKLLKAPPMARQRLTDDCWAVATEAARARDEALGRTDDPSEPSITFDVFATVLANQDEGARQTLNAMSGDTTGESWVKVGKELQKARDAFAACDEDGSGEIDREELGRVLGKLGADNDAFAVTKLMELLDEDGDGTVSFMEFLEGIASGAVSKGEGKAGASAFNVDRLAELGSVFDKRKVVTDTEAAFEIRKMSPMERMGARLLKVNAKKADHKKKRKEDIVSAAAEANKRRAEMRASGNKLDSHHTEVTTGTLHFDGIIGGLKLPIKFGVIVNTTLEHDGRASAAGSAEDGSYDGGSDGDSADSLDEHVATANAHVARVAVTVPRSGAVAQGMMYGAQGAGWDDETAYDTHVAGAARAALTEEALDGSGAPRYQMYGADGGKGGSGDAEAPEHGAVGHGKLHILSDAQRRSLKFISVCAMLTAGVVGAVAGIIVGVAEADAKATFQTDGFSVNATLLAEPPLGPSDPVRGRTETAVIIDYWLYAGTVSIMMSILELALCFLNALRAAMMTSKIVGLVLYPPDAERGYVMAALARAALEIPHPSASGLPIDPLREARKKKCAFFLVGMLYKGKRGLASFIFKLMAKRVFTRAAAKKFLPLLSAPINAFFNILVFRKVMRDARMVVLGPSAIVDFVDKEVANGAALSLVTRQQLLRCVGVAAVGKVVLHPNQATTFHHLMAVLGDLKMDPKTLRPPELDDTDRFFELLAGTVNEVERSLQVRTMIFCLMIDGRLTPRERRIYRRMCNTCGLPDRWDVVKWQQSRLMAGMPINFDVLESISTRGADLDDINVPQPRCPRVAWAVGKCLDCLTI